MVCPYLSLSIFIYLYSVEIYPVQTPSKIRGRAVALLWAGSKDGGQNEHGASNRAQYGYHHDDVEHLLLELVAAGPEVHQNDAGTIERVVEQRADKRQSEDPERSSAEDLQGIVVDGGPEANQRDIYDVNQEEDEDRQTADAMKQPGPLTRLASVHTCFS